MASYCYILQPNLSIRNKVQNQLGADKEIKALTSRLLVQSWRRPSMIITGILQPLLWLILFGALFQNAPIGLFTSTDTYSDFIGGGIIVFTAFTGALNAGLPIIFDREFGFLNRLLSSPMYSRYSIVYSSSVNIALTSLVQVSIIIYVSFLMGNAIPSIINGAYIGCTLLLLSNSVTNLSLILAFILPGHVELLASLVIINLPFLFSSTALAPLIFMPSWLQIIASLNPLSYIIEIIRYTYSHELINYNDCIMQTVWGPLNMIQITAIMICINCLSIKLVDMLITKRFEE